MGLIVKIGKFEITSLPSSLIERDGRGIESTILLRSGRLADLHILVLIVDYMEKGLQHVRWV